MKKICTVFGLLSYIICLILNGFVETFPITTILFFIISLNLEN